MAPLLFEETIVFPFDDILLRKRISDGTEKNRIKESAKTSIGNKPKIKVEIEEDYNPQDVLNRSVHLCNRCWATFMGIDAYYAHRNEGCQHSQVFIEGVQNSNKETDFVNTKSHDTNPQNKSDANNGNLCSREVKQELLDIDEVHALQGSTNDVQTEEDMAKPSSTIPSNHGHNQTLNIDPSDKSNLNGGTIYINPKFPSARENIQRSYGYDKQLSEKVPQSQQNHEELRFSKKRSMNVLSPDQLSNSLSTQPIKKIKLSESSKELSRELAKILGKQLNNLNNESKHKQNSATASNSLENESMRVKFSESIKLSESMKSSKELDALLQTQNNVFNQENNITNNYSDTTLSKSKNDKDLENFNLIQNSINRVSFHNKYSKAYNSRSEFTKRHIREKNKPSEIRLADSCENLIKPVNKKCVSKSTSQDPDTQSKCFEWIKKNERFRKALNIPINRISKFKSNTLVMYNLNINTRSEWLRAIFQRYGNVRNLNIKRYTYMNRAKGVVEFERLSDAEKAYQLCYNRVIDGSRIKLHFYHYSLNRIPNGNSSSTTEFGMDYKARFTGKPVRYYCDRDQRPGPYNSVQNPVRNHCDKDQRPVPYNLFS